MEVHGVQRSAFTIIELIFVIVILGILAALALPKMAATRDDAKLSKDVRDMAVCIMDAGTTYTATGADVSTGDSRACDAVKCYDITFASGGSDFVVALNAGGADYCTNVASAGENLARSYSFAASQVSY